MAQSTVLKSITYVNNVRKIEQKIWNNTEYVKVMLENIAGDGVIVDIPTLCGVIKVMAKEDIAASFDIRVDCKKGKLLFNNPSFGDFESTSSRAKIFITYGKMLEYFANNEEDRNTIIWLVKDTDKAEMEYYKLTRGDK